jgi:hypothetical protein
MIAASRLESMADKALDVVERALACDDARLAFPVAMKIIEHVFAKCGIGDTANSQPTLSPEEKEPRLRIIAQIIADDLERFILAHLPRSPKRISRCIYARTTQIHSPITFSLSHSRTR